MRGSEKDEVYGPFPAPDGVFYSTCVVWVAVVAWQIREWAALRGWQG